MSRVCYTTAGMTWSFSGKATKFTCAASPTLTEVGEQEIVVDANLQVCIVNL